MLSDHAPSPREGTIERFSPRAQIFFFCPPSKYSVVLQDINHVSLTARTKPSGLLQSTAGVSLLSISGFTSLIVSAWNGKLMRQSKKACAQPDYRKTPDSSRSEAESDQGARQLQPEAVRQKARRALHV
jgi:hypothetical protein